MKKLNITKEQFNKSKYFQRKYGKLEYVSESGRYFKTDKGNVLKFVKESEDDEWKIDNLLAQICQYKRWTLINADDTSVTISQRCPLCKEEVETTFDMGKREFALSMKNYIMNRPLIQQAFPELDAEDRESIKTGICSTCWEML